MICKSWPDGRWAGVKSWIDTKVKEKILKAKLRGETDIAMAAAKSGVPTTEGPETGRSPKEPNGSLGSVKQTGPERTKDKVTTVRKKDRGLIGPAGPKKGGRSKGLGPKKGARIDQAKKSSDPGSGAAPSKIDGPDGPRVDRRDDGPDGPVNPKEPTQSAGPFGPGGTESRKEANNMSGPTGSDGPHGPADGQGGLGSLEEANDPGGPESGLDSLQVETTTNVERGEATSGARADTEDPITEANGTQDTWAWPTRETLDSITGTQGYEMEDESYDPYQEVNYDYDQEPEGDFQEEAEPEQAPRHPSKKK